MNLQFGLRIPPCSDLREVAATVADAEAAGFHTAWLPDSQFLWRDVWSALALAADRTSRIELGTCVTNFETRHTTVTASAAATLAELAPGRVILGVGSGDSAVKPLGIKPTLVRDMRDEIALVRLLLAGSAADFDGREMRLHCPPAPVPLYLAATGPRMLQLAGEVADGVIVLAGTAPELIAAAVGHIHAGAERAGRDPAEINICLGTFCYITDDPTEAAKVVKPYCVTLAQIGGDEALKRVGIDVRVPAVVPGVYPDMSHAEDWDHAIRVSEEWISDEMGRRYAETFCLVGSVDHCIDRLEAAAAHGITSFYIRHFSSYTLPRDLLSAFASRILPHFSSGGTAL